MRWGCGYKYTGANRRLGGPNSAARGFGRCSARGVLGGAEGVNYGENVDGKQPDYVNDNPVDILAILQRNLSRLRPLAREAT